VIKEAAEENHGNNDNQGPGNRPAEWSNQQSGKSDCLVQRTRNSNSKAVTAQLQVGVFSQKSSSELKGYYIMMM
jgi:hypothetical protein